MDPITCPSCGSKYNPETHELVEDTNLPATVAELQETNRSLRTDFDSALAAQRDLKTKLDTAQARLDILDASPRANKHRDFIVGER